MNTKLDHLLGCVTEEAGEVQQVIGKIIRFGLHDHNRGQKNTNLADLKQEVHDLYAVYQMVMNELGEDIHLCLDTLCEKQMKVDEYMEYARDVGQLEKP